MKLRLAYIQKYGMAEPELRPKFVGWSEEGSAQEMPHNATDLKQICKKKFKRSVKITKESCAQRLLPKKSAQIKSRDT